jgi:hypothetical protein
MGSACDPSVWIPMLLAPGQRPPVLISRGSDHGRLSFSAAFIAHVEARSMTTIAIKNDLCAPIRRQTSLQICLEICSRTCEMVGDGRLVAELDAGPGGSWRFHIR